MTNKWWDAGEAALQAVVGDYLDAKQSPLSFEMALFDHGLPLEALPSGTSKLCVLVHGMGCTETCWSFPEEPELDYGRCLERDHGLTPLYVRYNTGLSIESNGHKLAALLAAVVARSPVPVQEITLIGHSLGGLIIRSACHMASDEPWLALVSRAFYLGTPHLGSPLEKAGHVATSALQAIRDPVVQLLAQVAALRSAAVKGLRTGDLFDDGQAVPLDEGIDHYFVAGTLPGPLAAILGDGLVPIASALGLAASATEGEREERVGMFPGINHMALTRDPDVYAWISKRSGPRQATTAVIPKVGAARDPRRLDAYRELVRDAVDKGASAVQVAHEAIASRPYDALEKIPPLQGPSRTARRVHFGVLRGSYAGLRWLNEMAGTAAVDDSEE